METARDVVELDAEESEVREVDEVADDEVHSTTKARASKRARLADDDALVSSSAEVSSAVVESTVEGSEAQLVVAPEDRSRLMIKQIVLENFKSYGDRKIIGPFHKSFSSIVGPNGSGKSNTIDALLFVFGKRAKKMRLNKVSELIHSSTTRQNLGSAKVEVIFQDIIDTGDGPEDYEVVPGSELSVTREAFRNNSSKYYVDGKGSNFTEVTTLLRRRGVDLEHNRFLILQGEVEQISLMKPKAQSPHEDGLLEYLEDIIGSNRLVEPIQQADVELERLTEQRQERLNRLRLAERERDSLDGPRREAEAWISSEAERLELQSLLAQSEAQKSHSGVASLEKEHLKLQGHMEDHRKKMEGYERQVKAIESEHNGILKDYNSIKVQMEKSALDFKEFERQDVKFTEDIGFHEQKLVKLQQTAERDAETAKKLLADAERTRREAPLREKELESSERFKVSCGEKVEKLLEGLKGKAEKLRGPKEAKEAELVPLQKRLTEVRKVVEVAQVEAQLLREKTSKVAEEIDVVKQESAECGRRLESRQQEAEDAGKMKRDREKLVADATVRLSGVVEQVERMTQEVASTRVKAEEARAAFEQEHSRGKLIRSVYEQSKAGRLKGVHGRLGDLGTINKKYDVAVSTACSMLDAIVVDSTEDAQAVIEFIRREDLGRTTCICLSQIQNLQKEFAAVVQTPEDTPRLVDVIKPAKPEYTIAFFFALRHTLVAKDLEQATRIGLQGRTRWRVVTLDGQLIDTSGTMSGGGNAVAKGGMRASLCMFSQEEVKTFVQSYEKANSTLATLRQERRSLEEALQLTDKEIAEYDLREKKCVMDIASLSKQMSAYDVRLKNLTVPTLSSQEKSKLKELEKLTTSKAKELNDIQAKHQAVEEEVRELHNQIMNIGGEELKIAKAKFDEVSKKCEDMRRNVKKALLDADNMEKNSKRAEANVQAAQADYVATEKVLVTLRKEHAALDDKAEAVLNSYNQLKDTLVQKDQVLTTLRAKRDQELQAAAALKNQEVDLVHEMEEKTRALRELTSRVAAWGAKLQEARAEWKQLPMDLLDTIRKAPVDVTGQDMGQSLARKAITSDLSADELRSVVRADVEARTLTLEEGLKNLRPNLASIEEFRRVDAEHKTRLADYETLHLQREEARRQLEAMRQKRLDEFMDGFSIISMKLKEMYQMITLGGDAELELVDTLDPFSEGINFSVRPPKKSWKQITNLSGGEKTLASLSLVFALHHYKPTPLYFMDEIDAALDFRNVSIIANYIKERTKNAQFIVISLRNHMFELADLLVGIYKTSDISKSVAIDPTSFNVERAPLHDRDGTVEPPLALGEPAQSATLGEKRRRGGG